MTFGVKLELRPLGPYVGGIEGDVNRQIADELDSKPVDVLFERLPLLEETVLLPRVIGDFRLKFPVPLLNSLELVIP